MMQPIRLGWAFFRENDLRSVLRHVTSKEAHPFLQFVKYGLCGALSVVIHTIVFALLSHWLNPAVDLDLGDTVRARRATVNNGIAFLFSNLTAYYTNVKWVFVQGRHRPWQEFLLFTGVSAVSFSAGILLVPLLIKGFGMHTWIAQGAFVFTSALVNYVCRKFIVFRG